jgi:outer membrane lipoprotein-sorting protein
MLNQIPLLAMLAAASAPVSQEAVLAKMDEAAAAFRSMTGKIRKTTHTAVINDDSVESGTIRLRRQNQRDIRLLVDIAEPDPKSYALQGRKAEVYYPKIQTVQEYDLGKQGQLLDQFLLLGFGAPTRELRDAYEFRLGGEETVAGQKTARIELIPKSQKTRQHLTKAELWISLDTGHTVQQKFHEPSGDYRLATYTEMKWNPDLADSALRLQLPKNVKREFPQR